LQRSKRYNAAAVGANPGVEEHRQEPPRDHRHPLRSLGLRGVRRSCDPARRCRRSL